jgi:hypothetical protein
MGTTLDTIPFPRLGEILRPCLENRRLFVSACEMVNNKLAEAIIPKSGCYSIIGPSEKINFSSAAILWASFYHLMFNYDSDVMTRERLLKHCKQLAQLFSVSLNYYSTSKTQKRGFKFTEIKPGK